MESDERRRMEAAMAKISQAKREAEVDPAAAMRAAVDEETAKFKRRSFYVLLLLILLVGITLYLRDRG